MNASTKIKNFIKSHEGLRLDAYKCPAGVLTIGYGHTGADVQPGMRISKERASELFDKDLAGVARPLNAYLRENNVTLSQHQYDALLSFAYNVGVGALRNSTLWRKLRVNPSDPTIPSEFKRWTLSRGKTLPGLVKRRQAEASIYLNGNAEGYE